METTKKYWKGFEELNNTSEFQKNKRNEFNEDLPILNELGNLVSEQTSTRRDFLKVLGFSTVAATIAASCEIPVNKIIPYTFKPEEIIPGIANYYASSFMNGKDFCSILVKTREGRPIKIEGNNTSGITNGGTSARTQASVVSLYDGHRLRNPKKKGQKITWQNADNEIKSALSTTNGLVLLSGSILSPTTQKLINEFVAKYNGKHVVYEAISNAGILQANQQNFGKSVIPSLDFSKADTIVSFGADFLGTWISPIEFAKQWAVRRTINREKPSLSKHWQFESHLSLTGSNADKRFTIKPSQEGAAVVALYNELSGTGSASLGSDALNKAIKQAAAELKAAAGKSLVVSGSNNPNIQSVVNAINAMLGNYGTTIDLNNPYKISGDDKAMHDLVDAMNAGSVGSLIIYNTNPAYSYPEADKFIAGLKKVPLSISLNEYEDETSENTTYLLPDNNYLESWNDAEFKTGYYSLAQPAISTLFDTRQAQNTLLSLMGSEINYYDYLRNNWQASLMAKQTHLSSFDSFWDAALHDGIFELNNPTKTKGALAGGNYINGTILGATTQETVSETTNSSPSNIDVQAAIQAIAAIKSGGVEVKLYETTVMGDGRYANNPYLQETPEPISKVCWDNVISVSPDYAKAQGWKELDIIEVSIANHTIELPLIYQPGLADGAAAIALGYGRTKAGHEQCNRGKNAFPFLTYNGQTFDNVITNATLSKKGEQYPLARTQTHSTIDDKREIILETTFAEYTQDKWAGNHTTHHRKEEGDKEFFTLYGSDKDYGDHKDFYGKGLHWNLNIDLNLCIGCGACVPACHIENNVPIVGQNEVKRVHEMHWIRIDRYYSGDMNNPDVTFMPMMCHHCDNAPCENVCPVAATNHSSEGLNQMAYNRCIGTRYCANNCPYKVRRFNWFDYQEADSFYKNTVFNNDEHSVMIDDLSRMVLNPDVTVRSRGVIEKCSFCVQRIQDGKLQAKKQDRVLGDGDIKTACQQACPTNAIVFGNVNSPETEINKRLANERTYTLLEEIHVMPNLTYMTKVRNREALASTKHKHEQHHDEEHKREEHKEG